MIFIQDAGSNLDRRRIFFLKKAARATLKQEGVTPEPDLSIVIDNDETLRQLNLRFMGIDEPTDVLSFPAGETDPETGKQYLGDVVISYQQAQHQAANRQHSIEDELQLLVVHGILHLLGHDHAEEEEKRRMWTAQKQVLSNLGNPINPDQDE